MRFTHCSLMNDLISFISRLVRLLVINCVIKHQDLQIFGPKLNKYMSNFQPLEAVDRGSETQLQVAEN